MTTQFCALGILNHAIRICKEKQYLELEEEIHMSYLDLIAVETDCLRGKSSAIIKSMQIFDRELKLLKFQYERVKVKHEIDKIEAIENYINEIEKHREKLKKEKNAIK